jgi:hypothetical protein
MGGRPIAFPLTRTPSYLQGTEVDAIDFYSGGNRVESPLATGYSNLCFQFVEFAHEHSLPCRFLTQYMRFSRRRYVIIQLKKCYQKTNIPIERL